MINLSQFQELLANSLFGGDLSIAGIVIYAVVLAVIFVIFKKDFHIGIIISIPVTLVFSLLNIVPSEATLLMIVIAVLVLAMGAKKTFGE